MNELKEGQRFNDFDDFTAAVNAYGIATNAVFTTLDSKRNGRHQYIKLACKHYGNPRSKSKGIRPFQKTFKQNCPVFVYAKRMEGCVSITRLALKHENHKCDPVVVSHYPERRQLDKYEKKVVETLVSDNIGPSVIRNKVRKLTGKPINAQDMVNLRYKLQEESTSEVEEMIAVLVELLQLDKDAVVILGIRSSEDPALNVRLLNLRSRMDSESTAEEPLPQSDNILMFVFIQLGMMRKTFSKYPQVLLMNNRHDITDNCIPLNICMGLDSYGGGNVISYMLVGNEVDSTTASVLNCLKVANPGITEKITTVVLDKDPNDRTVVSDILGDDVTIEIYPYYALQSLMQSTHYIEDRDVKEATCKTLKSIVCAETEEDYLIFKEKLKQVAPEDYYQYFLYNWDYAHEAWVTYEKFYVPNDLSNGESENEKLKKVLESSSSLVDSIHDLLLCHQVENNVLFQKFDLPDSSNCPADESDPDVAAIESSCTPFAAKLMCAEICAVDAAHKCASSGKSCECVFYKSLHLPCRHIFHQRKILGESKFRLEDIPDRWLKTSQVESRTPAVSIQVAASSCSAPDSMSAAEAYDQAMEVCEKICHILSKRDDEQFEAGLRTLEEIRDHWLAGREVVMAEVSMTSNELAREWSTATKASASSTAASVVSASPVLGPLGINCDCGELVARRTITRGRRKGEQFFACARKENRCSFVKSIPETSKQNTSESERDLAQRIRSDLRLPQAFKVRVKPNLGRR